MTLNGLPLSAESRNGGHDVAAGESPDARSVRPRLPKTRHVVETAGARGPRRVVPSLVTFAGGVAGVLAVGAWAQGNYAVAGPLAAASVFADMADGWIARRIGAVSRGGAAFDWHTDVALAHAALAAGGHFLVIPVLAFAQAVASSAGIRVSGRTLVWSTLLLLEVFGASGGGQRAQ